MVDFMVSQIGPIVPLMSIKDKIGPIFSFFFLRSNPMVDCMVSRNSPILLLLVDNIGPIHDTIKSTVAALGTEKWKLLQVNRITCKIGEQSL